MTFSVTVFMFYGSSVEKLIHLVYGLADKADCLLKMKRWLLLFTRKTEKNDTYWAKRADAAHVL